MQLASNNTDFCCKNEEWRRILQSSTSLRNMVSWNTALLYLSFEIYLKVQPPITEIELPIFQKTKDGFRQKSDFIYILFTLFASAT